ncbi:MAG: PD-(D/E)XK nuclease family protein [Nitrospirota bacterium]
MLKPILDSIPLEDDQRLILLKDLSCSILNFVTDYARVSNEMDGEAKAAIKERFEEIAAMSTKTVSLEDAINEIELILRGIRVGQAGPAPGCLHISSYQNGGRSGRHHSFIIGCDAQTFPGTLIQNPILLDEEMQAISEHLIPSSDLLKEKLYRISSLLASRRGSITLSFSSFDILENRESFPSSILLQVFRLTSGDINANYTDFMKALGLPSGYIPSGQHLDTSDFWITSFIGKHGLKQPDQTVLNCYPGLLQGMKAREARETDQVTEYDGLLHAPDRERDPRENMSMVVSASSLEKFANCPYAYFLNYVLKVKPLEEIAFEADTWLDGMQRGSLLHEVFNRFMKKITGKNEKPSVQKHIPLIEWLLEEVITEFREELPPPSEAIFEQEKKILRKATHVFLKTEENRCKKYTPVFFELAFGYEDAEGEIKEPIKIPIGSGKSFNAAGRIDRIDEIADGEYAVMDYKTGSAYEYNEKNVFNKGKTIQHALYAIAAENILQKLLKNKTVRVSQSGYIFPTEKETGRQIVYARHDKEFIQLLTVIFDAVKAGIFIPADDKGVCTYCDYTDICGEGITGNAKLKRNNTENTEIEILRQLKNYG